MNRLPFTLQTLHSAFKSFINPETGYLSTPFKYTVHHGTLLYIFYRNPSWIIPCVTHRITFLMKMIHMCLVRLDLCYPSKCIITLMLCCRNSDLGISVNPGWRGLTQRGQHDKATEFTPVLFQALVSHVRKCNLTHIIKSAQIYWDHLEIWDNCLGRNIMFLNHEKTWD